jgi:hypothetical protein
MSASSTGNDPWIPLMDYAMKNGVSLSTLRRYIKAGKIRHKSEHGKYFILDDASTRAEMEPKFGGRGMPMASRDWVSSNDAGPQIRPASLTPSAPSASTSSLEARVAALESQHKRTQEELSELKMLVAIYEDRIFRDAPSA